MADVFISYSRRNQEFAQILNEALKRSSYKTWVDWQDIPSTSIWWEEIKAGIEAAHTFVFVLSPDAVVSDVCHREVEHAVKHNKRLIPIVRRDGFKSKQVHPAVSKINWLFFRKDDDFDGAFQLLIKAIDIDLEHVHTHTRLLVRAIEWNDEKRDRSFLLHDRDLDASEQWLEKNRNKNPKPTDLQIAYITASQKFRQQLQAVEASYKQAELNLQKAVIYHQPKPRWVLLTSTIVTFLVLFIRLLEILQPLELTAYDWMMRLRPSEKPDDRILIVEVAEDDIKAQHRRGEQFTGSLSNDSLKLLLEKLKLYQPRLIGLDIYRDLEANQADLNARLSSDDRLFVVCKVSDIDSQGKVTKEGIPAPEGFPSERVGFSDVIPDKDGVIRRHLLLQQQVSNSPCISKYSFSLLLAQRYLALEAEKDIHFQDPLLSGGNLQLGDTVFKRLHPSTGGYQLETEGGYQILLNYRAQNGDPIEVFKRVSLEAVLTGQVSEQDIQDRIVLIGVASTDKASRDFDPWGTPYRLKGQKAPGVFIQAQMVSQLLSSVLDGRPLLWVWPFEGEVLWIWGWALVGGILTRHTRRRRWFGFAVIIALSSLLLTCFFLLTQAGWAPFVPSALSLMITGGTLVYVAFRPAASPNSLAASEQEQTAVSSVSPKK